MTSNTQPATKVPSSQTNSTTAEPNKSSFSLGETTGEHPDDTGAARRAVIARSIRGGPGLPGESPCGRPVTPLDVLRSLPPRGPSARGTPLLTSTGCPGQPVVDGPLRRALPSDTECTRHHHGRRPSRGPEDAAPQLRAADPSRGRLLHVRDELASPPPPRRLGPTKVRSGSSIVPCAARSVGRGDPPELTRRYPPCREEAGTPAPWRQRTGGRAPHSLGRRAPSPPAPRLTGRRRQPPRSGASSLYRRGASISNRAEFPSIRRRLKTPASCRRSRRAPIPESRAQAPSGTEPRPTAVDEQRKPRNLPARPLEARTSQDRPPRPATPRGGWRRRPTLLAAEDPGRGPTQPVR